MHESYNRERDFDMAFSKRVLIKPLIILVIAAAVFAYSYYKNRQAEKAIPEIAAMEEVLENPESDASAIFRAYTKAESSLMRKKEYDTVLRLTSLVRKSGRTSKELTNVLDFSEYSACFFSGKYQEALEKLDTIEANPQTIPEVKGAVAGEKMRCIAAMKGIDSAILFFDAFLKEKTTRPEMLLYAYDTCINVLFQYEKNDEALKRTVDGANATANPDTIRHFLERLGRFLVREQDPERKLHALMPAIDIRKYCTVMNAIADEYIALQLYDKAEQILNSVIGNRYVPQELKKVAGIKQTICKEKKAAAEKAKAPIKPQPTSDR